ncbi:protein CURVATURE THYLAKOID 1B, chloroplastic-like [Wolffia australiana]
MATAGAACLGFSPPSASLGGRSSPSRHLLPLSNLAALPSLRRSHCRRTGTNTISTGSSDGSLVRTRSAAGEGPDFSEVLAPLQETWDKIEDKYAVAILGVSGFIALWVSTGMISAIDRLPVIPGVLELVGIGYSGWFAYQNLIFKPDREALVEKLKGALGDITGSE